MALPVTANCTGDRHGLWRQNAWTQRPSLPYLSCVTVSKVSNRFAGFPWFPDLETTRPLL